MNFHSLYCDSILFLVALESVLLIFQKKYLKEKPWYSTSIKRVILIKTRTWPNWKPRCVFFVSFISLSCRLIDSDSQLGGTSRETAFFSSSLFLLSWNQNIKNKMSPSPVEPRHLLICFAFRTTDSWPFSRCADGAPAGRSRQRIVRVGADWIRLVHPGAFESFLILFCESFSTNARSPHSLNPPYRHQKPSCCVHTHSK